jgi:hypothetical protein
MQLIQYPIENPLYSPILRDNIILEHRAYVSLKDDKPETLRV